MTPPGTIRSFVALCAAVALVDANPARAASDTALKLTNTGAAATAYVRIPNHADFSLQRFTLEAWVQRIGIGYGFSNDASGAAILDKPTESFSGSNLGSWHVTYNLSGQVLFNLAHTFSISGTYIQTPVLPDPLARHHIAATFDGDSTRVFVDGVQRASGAWTLGTVAYGGQDVLIGASNFGSGYLRRFDGIIDDVRIWDRALSGAQIAARMNCRLSGAEDGLVAYYPFDASTLVDATGHGHDGANGGLAASLAYGPMVALSNCLVDVPAPAPLSGLALDCFPRPARADLAVRFALPEAATVRLELFDVAGRRLSTLAAGDFAAGEHRLPGRIDLGATLGDRSGVFFLRLVAGERHVVQPFVRVH